MTAPTRSAAEVLALRLGPPQSLPEHVRDRYGYVWRLVRDGGMASRADDIGILTEGIVALENRAGPLVPIDTFPPTSELALAVMQAVGMLGEETHRYVERFSPCPRGCRFDYAREGSVEGRAYPLQSPVLVRTAGPADCDVCSEGTVEDENAEHLNPFLALLEQAALALREETPFSVGGMHFAPESYAPLRREDVRQVLLDVLGELAVNAEASDVHALPDLRADVGQYLTRLARDEDEG